MGEAADRDQVARAYRLDRRRFLQHMVASTAVVAVPGLWRIEPAAAAPKGEPPGQTRQPRDAQGPQRRANPSLTVVLRRREDQLHLGMEFYNLKLDTSGQQPVLVRKNSNGDAHVVVVFLPQHIMEEAAYEYDPDLQTADFDPPPNQDDADPQTSVAPPPPPLGSRLAGASRLAFRLPTDTTSIPFDVEGLLEWEDWIPSVVPAARASAAIAPITFLDSPPQLQPPGPLHTAIELPWWLILSPHVQTGWNHAHGAVSRDGRTELWHTRMGGRAPDGEVDESDEARMTVRAVWTRDPEFPDYLDDQQSHPPPDGEDFDLHPIGMPFRTPLSPRDRYDLVVSTSDYEHLVAKTGYEPVPAQVDRLMLSPLGGWLDLQGTWNAGAGILASGTTLESWRHRATMGRDHYVRIVRSGFLFPYGFAASLIKVTERKFRTIGSGGRGDPKRRIAYLFQRYFLVVRQPHLSYGGSLQPADGRAFPFTEVVAKTLITPNLDPPGDDPDDPYFSGLPTTHFPNKTQAFVPRVGGTPLRFHLVGTDRVSRDIDLNTPVVFVDGIKGTQTGPMEALRDWYDSRSETAPERSFDVQGAAVAVAPVEPGTPPGPTDLEIHRLTLGAELPTTTDDALLASLKQPAFFPTLSEAEIRLAAAEATLGGDLGGLPVVVYDPSYVQHDFAGAGKGEVFVQLKDTENPTLLDFGGNQAGNRSGGVLTPNIGVTALSRRTGTVAGDPAAYQAGTFEPADFFGALAATLLGDITLEDVIEAVTGADFDLSDDTKKDRVLQLTSRETTDAIVTELRWRPGLRNVPPGSSDASALFIAHRGQPATLDVQATITTPKSAPQDSTFLVIGDLRDFQVGLLPGARFIVIEFDRLRFQSETGKKTDVDVEIADVVFAGPLEFVNQLKEYLNFSSGGFSIELLPTHLDAGFQIPIPNITVGVFSLSNISFAAGAIIPFTGKPVRFRFGFSSQEDPFLLSVMIFGGGGFFELALGADGVETFQAALEFGAMASLDFGVASGSISITAGIYLAIGIEKHPDNPDGATELTGFIKLRGEVRVMGVVSLSILMKASFTYLPSSKKALVKSVIVVEVDVVVVSGSVEIEYEKRFGGSEDPTFGQALAQADWDTYADAFAAIGA